ncbi:MAG: hypothetical protein OEY86_04335 [Nitrospira sp.]|nr:hypothetical protein [Nitrospira sp.]
MDSSLKPDDRPFNPWRILTGDHGPFFRHVLLTLEAHSPVTRRKRKPVDQARYERLVNAVLCDVAYNYLQQEPCNVHLSRSCAVLSQKFLRRYRPEFLTGKMLPMILDTMETAGLLVQEIGQQGPRPANSACANQTRITAGPSLITLLRQYGVTAEQITANYAGQEIVVLKGEKDDWFTDADLADYDDTSDTTKYRNEVRTINEWLREAPISVVPDMSSIVDVRERHLRRYFTRSSFQSGGRLFGGFWQQMSKRDRLKCLQIHGGDIVEKDYNAVAPRLLYGLAGQSIPSVLLDDPYRIPGFERSRDGIKKVFNALLFDLPTTQRKRFPADSHTKFDPQELQRVGGRVQPVIEAIKKAHDPVADYFRTGVGHRLMFLESSILVAVLLELRQREALALPIHDAVLIGQKDGQIVERVMLDQFERISGKAGKVSTITLRDGM